MAVAELVTKFLASVIGMARDRFGAQSGDDNPDVPYLITTYHGSVPVRDIPKAVMALRKEGKRVTKLAVAEKLGVHRATFNHVLNRHDEIAIFYAKVLNHPAFF